MIVLIEGCGSNIASVQLALTRLGFDSVLSSDPDTIRSATHIILPGVGVAKKAMDNLQRLGLVDVIRDLKQPVLGICLGMQLLYAFSHEGDVPCLNIIPGKIQSFIPTPDLVVPHMGWNQIQKNHLNSPLLKGVNDLSYFYFVHSYFAPIGKETIATCFYDQVFSAVVALNNFYGMQFHPERSGDVGETLLRNFLSL